MCDKNAQVNRQACLARILFARFFRIFSTINKILLDAQIREYDKKLTTKPNDTPQDKTNSTPRHHHINTVYIIITL